MDLDDHSMYGNDGDISPNASLSGNTNPLTIWVSFHSCGLLGSELPHPRNPPDYRPGNSPPEIYAGWEIDRSIARSSRDRSTVHLSTGVAMQITFCHTPYAGNRVDIGSYLNHIQFPYRRFHKGPFTVV